METGTTNVILLAAGLYRLPTDLTNPNVDRRKKRDWTRREVIKAGTYRVRVFENEPLDGMRTIDIRPMVGLYDSVKAVVKGDMVRSSDLYNLLASNFTPLVSPTLKELLHESQWETSAEDVLAYLFNKERITVDQVRDAVNKLEVMNDKEKDDLLANTGFAL